MADKTTELSQWIQHLSCESYGDRAPSDDVKQATVNKQVPLSTASSSTRRESNWKGDLSALGRDRTTPAMSATTSTPIRQRATVLFDTVDGGHLMVSYDAPVQQQQPRPASYSRRESFGFLNGFVGRSCSTSSGSGPHITPSDQRPAVEAHRHQSHESSVVSPAACASLSTPSLVKEAVLKTGQRASGVDEVPVSLDGEPVRLDVELQPDDSRTGSGIGGAHRVGAGDAANSAGHDLQKVPEEIAESNHDDVGVGIDDGCANRSLVSLPDMYESILAQCKSIGTGSKSVATRKSSSNVDCFKTPLAVPLVSRRSSVQRRSSMGSSASSASSSVRKMKPCTPKMAIGALKNFVRTPITADKSATKECTPRTPLGAGKQAFKTPLPLASESNVCVTEVASVGKSDKSHSTFVSNPSSIKKNETASPRPVPVTLPTNLRVPRESGSTSRPSVPRCSTPRSGVLGRPGPGANIHSKQTPRAGASVTPSDRTFEVTARRLPSTMTSQLAVRSVARSVAPASGSLKVDSIRQLKQKWLETGADRKSTVLDSEGSGCESRDGSRSTSSASSMSSQITTVAVERCADEGQGQHNWGRNLELDESPSPLVSPLSPGEQCQGHSNTEGRKTWERRQQSDALVKSCIYDIACRVQSQLASLVGDEQGSLKDDTLNGSHLEASEEAPQCPVCPQWKSSDPYLAATMRRLLATEQQLVVMKRLNASTDGAHVSNNNDHDQCLSRENVQSDVVGRHDLTDEM